MSMYDRQETLQLKTPTVTIVGAGGIGFWAAKFAAMSGIEKIYIFDPDTIEESNLNRLDLTIEHIGRNKADVAKEAIVALRPYISVYAMPFILLEHTFEKTDWLIDCTDKIKSQTDNQAIANKFGSKYVKAGYNGESITIANSVATWGEAPDGYTVTPSWVVPSVVVAAMTVAKIMKYESKEISTKIEKMFEYSA